MLNDSLPVASPEQDLSRLREMLRADDIEGARSLVKQLAVEWPDSKRVQHLAKVLAPPRVTVSEREPSRPLHSEREWLKKNAHHYPNQWLSVYRGKLIASSPDLKEVIAKTREEIGNEEALVHYQSSS